MRFDETGLGVAVGTSGGLVALFDLRAQRPTVVKDHMYGQRITDIKFHTSGEGGAGALGLAAPRLDVVALNCQQATCNRANLRHAAPSHEAGRRRAQHEAATAAGLSVSLPAASL